MHTSVPITYYNVPIRVLPNVYNIFYMYWYNVFQYVILLGQMN